MTRTSRPRRTPLSEDCWCLRLSDRICADEDRAPNPSRSHQLRVRTCTRPGRLGEAAGGIPRLISVTCSTCGAEVPDGARFCPTCGADLQVRGDERRVVTVVFADLVGFTGLSEHRDPEQVKALVDRCFERLVADIVAFGGRVDKIVGDAILALFGAPVAHEDDPERAVRAALAMQETMRAYRAEVGAPIQMRIGVNTGEVLTGAMRAGGDYTAMGDVVNTANRLQTAAQGGEVLVGSATYNATA